ncbi:MULTISPECIES: HAMP domain-containing sensor histidine kinase [unclassified Gluconobacter]|uniref:sensor histidine kinase n=1 Tax=unclassified Gluconobacter TaxID=2644261 RepID=UPI001E48FF9A|nr:MULTISPECIES: HAMP domain-containing sensor histidine kinase [unclassified Gluconobacter]
MRNDVVTPSQGPSPFRSSSFRIVALFAGCFVISGVTVMAFSGYHSLNLLSQQIKQSVANERDEALSEARIKDVAHLEPVMSELVRNEPGFYYLLQNASEHIVVGNMLHLRHVPGWRTLSWTHRSLPPDYHPVIGYGLILQDGGYLFVGIDARPVQTLRRDLWFMLGWSAIGFILIGVAGGLVLSRLVLGKIEVISQTARDIMRGDLSRRLPLNAVNDEFDHLAVSLNAMLERNETLVASIRQVTDDIAHDMRRPLAHLGQHLESLSRIALPPAGAGVLNQARHNLDEALEIFASLLKLAQIEADDRVRDKQMLDVNEILLTISDLYRPILEDRNQSLNLSIPSHTMHLDGNRVLLTQMLANLLENATNHCPAGSQITLSSSALPGIVTIAVSDNGPGIPVHERERVFEKMVRLDRSRSVPGTGLGLSMVRAIVRLHGGQIRLLDNEPGLRCELNFPSARGQS